MFTIRIDGQLSSCDTGQTVLQVARDNGVEIPTLCHHQGLADVGACRICLVEVVGPGDRTSLMTACTLPVARGLEIRTETPAVQSSRRTIVELLLARAPTSEVIQQLAARCGVAGTRFAATAKADNCVLCGLCVRVCEERLGAEAITYAGRTNQRTVSAAFGKLSDSCLGCGACAAICPTGVMRLEDDHDVRRIWNGDLLISKRALVACGECGEPFATDEMLAWTAARLERANEQTAPDRATVCPDCARLTWARRMAQPLSRY